jgi:hypothetical protein
MFFRDFAIHSGFFRSLFSRAERKPKESWASAPEGRLETGQKHTSMAKADTFGTRYRHH